MATLVGPQPVECLSTPDLIAIAHCTTTRDELDTYLDHIDDCQLCAGVVARLLGRPFFTPAEVALEATS